MTEDMHQANSPNTEYVQPLLPVVSSEPLLFSPKNFISDFCLYWLMPKRRGPHLAMRSMWRAWSAFFIAVILSVMVWIVLPRLISTVALGEDWDLMRSISITRRKLSWSVLNAASLSHHSTHARIELMILLGFVPALFFGIFMLGTLLMPFAAAGDSPWSAWKRSVKNTFWSTTFLVPGSVVCVILVVLFDDGAAYGCTSQSGWFLVGKIVCFVVLALLGILLLRAITVGATQYIGEPNNSEVLPRIPRCDDCGYSLIHLPLDSRCPECGLPVAESLPGGRRGEIIWKRGNPCLSLLRMQWAMIRDRDFFRRVQIHQAVKWLKPLFWVNYLEMIALMFLLTLLFLLVEEVCFGIVGHKTYFSFYMGADVAINALLYLAPVLLLLLLLVTFPVSLWAQWRHGITDYRIPAVVCFASAPLLLPFLVSIYLSVIANATWLLGNGSLARVVQIEPFAVLAFFALALLLLLAFVFWLKRLTYAIKCVKYANA